MSKQSFVVLYEDSDGWSFVIIDPQHKVVYEDIVEERLIHNLYQMFDVKLTITNSEYRAPAGMTKSIGGNVSTGVSCLHTSVRAREFASLYWSQKMNRFMNLSDVPRKPLRLENETWSSWLA